MKTKTHTHKAVVIESDYGTVGYFAGNDYRRPEDDVMSDAADWGEEAEDVCQRLNESFKERGSGLFARVEITALSI